MDAQPATPALDVAAAAVPPDDAADLLPTRKQVDAATRDLTDITKRKIGAEATAQAEFDRRDAVNRARMERMYDAQGATADDLKPWDAQRELAQHKTDLWQQFGSPGFLIAMMGSAFSAQPMNAALSSGAAAMNAIHQGDMEGYNRAFQAWKENTDLVLKRSRLEQEMYDEADKLRTTDMTAWRTKVAAIATQFNDRRALALLENGMDEDLAKAIDAKGAAAGQIDKVQAAMVQQKAFMDALNGHPDPNGDHVDAKGTRMSGGDPRWYKGTDMAGAYLDVEKKFMEAQRAGLRMAGGGTLSGLEAQAIAERAAKLRQGDPNLSLDDAIAQAASEIKPAFSAPRSPATLAASRFIQAHPKASEQALLNFSALYTQTQARARTLGTRGANVDTAVQEAKGAAQQALAASDAVPRGNWVPLTRIQQQIQKGTSSPEMRRFSVANASLITAYAQTMSRTGTNTVTAQNRATEVLDTADGPDAYKAGVDQLLTEMEIVQQAVKDGESALDGDAAGGKDKVEKAPDNDPLGIR